MTAWKGLLNKVRDKGEVFTDANHKDSIELINQTITITELSDYKVPIQKMMGQQEFIYPKIDQMEKLILENNGMQTNFANRMYDFHGMNQLKEFIIPLLKKDSRTRRAVMSTYNPAMDSSINNKTVISILNFFFRIRNNKLHLSVFIRSLDCFLGFPANLLQATTLQKEVMKELGLEQGSITFFIGSVHLYLDNESFASKLLN